MPADDLYRLVGVSADAPVDRLRAAYEQAVGAATRSGDHQRALELSTAFDALPPAVKSRVYRNSRHGSGPVDPWYRGVPYADEPGPARRSPHRRPSRRARRSRGGAAPTNVLRRLFLLAAVALVTAFVVYLAFFDRPGPTPGMAPQVVLTTP